MGAIEHIHARQILDSRGNPTVEVDVRLDTGASGRAAVPSGASTGEFEATELRDGGDAWAGKGVGRGGRQRQRRDRQGAHRRATPPTRWRSTRRCSSSTGRRTSPGWARTRSSASRWRSPAPPRPRPELPLYLYLAELYGSSRDEATVLPVPMMNVINGGAHADNSVDLQEFMVVPAGAAQLRRGPAGRHRGLPRAEGDPEGARARHHGRRRGRLRPRPGVQRGGARGARRRDRGGGLRARGRRLHRPRPGDERALPRSDGAYVLEHEGRALSAEELGAYWADIVEPLPGDLDRGRDGRGGLGRLGAAHRARSATAASSSATTSSSPTRSGCGAGSRPGSATRSWSRSTRSAP